MTTPAPYDFDDFMNHVRDRAPHQPEFHQAVEEVLESVIPIVNEHRRYREAAILERMTEPDRVISFRVTWMDDDGRIQVNRAYRVQFNNAIGPYKGGLRFHPSVTLDTLKFLGFEQTLKNALTGLPMGGAKGGSDFDPKGKSDGEVMRFCYAMMCELQRHIGEHCDVPAGDIGVGGREIGYLFGQYKRLQNRFAGVLTGKGVRFGGSAGREEATGFGAVYFLREILKREGSGFEGKRAVVSGSGNVAIHAIEKLVELGSTVVTASDSSGFIHDPEGIAGDRLAYLIDLKENRRGRISEYAEEFGCAYIEGERPWGVPCDFALPCATQNELEAEGARQLAKNGACAVVEGANMPTSPAAAKILHAGGVILAPGKAANAGGVAVSGLEQQQNAMRLSWSHMEVDEKLVGIMRGIHASCVEHAERGRRDAEGPTNYVHGANVAGFLKVADAMVAYGAV